MGSLRPHLHSRAGGVGSESRPARTEAILLLVRASLLLTGAAALLVGPPAGTAAAVWFQLLAGTMLLLLAYPAAWLGREATARLARVAVVADVAIYAAYQLSFHTNPAAGTFYGIFVLLVGPSRWGWRGALATAVPVGLIATVWPQATATGSGLGVAATWALVGIFTLPAVLIGATVRRGSARLRQAQEQFRTAFEHASLGMVLLDDQGTVVQANHAICALLGVDEGDVVGQVFATRAVSAEREPLRRALAGLGVSHRGFRLEVQLERPDGGRRWGLVAASWLAGSSGVPAQVVLQVENVTERRWAEAQLSHQATHDALTGLPNRTLLASRLAQALERREPVAVLFLDLDRFKIVNDGLGHAAGDQLLVAVGARLSAAVRPGDLVARLGGDEFVVLCHDASGESEALGLATRLLLALEPPFLLPTGSETVRASLGVAVADASATPDTLVRDADTAMYRAKAAGGARVVVFTPELRAAAVRTHELEVDLRDAVRGGGLDVEYQPVVDLTTGRITGLEALARWRSPGRPTVCPTEFIALAEQSDLVVELGTAVMRRALTDLASWPVPPHSPSVSLAVNVSIRQLADPAFPGLVHSLLTDSGVDPGRLCLEVTETALVGDVDSLVESLRALRDVGVLLAIDDFGTGHASLTYLAQFPVDVVKVDRSFVIGVGQEAGSAAIVGGVVAMAHTFGMRVVAEGAETQEQIDVLRGLGCDSAQGYALARPMSAQAVHAVLATGGALGVPAPRVSPELSPRGADYAPARRYRLLLDAALALTACVDVDDILDQCFRSLRSLVAFTGGSIQLRDGADIRLVATDPPATPEALGSRVPVGQGVSGTIALTGDPMYLPDISVAPAVSASRRSTSTSGGVRSYYGVPLVAAGRIVGVLQIDSTEVGAFSEQDQLLVLAFAPVVAAAVHSVGAPPVRVS
ncbi:MAG: EAL domain-containing protein [Actinomycetota bacterium]|nr:EAL domain-containing protein [Actinomycetota bacterium]